MDDRLQQQRDDGIQWQQRTTQ